MIKTLKVNKIQYINQERILNLLTQKVETNNKQIKSISHFQI